MYLKVVKQVFILRRKDRMKLGKKKSNTVLSRAREKFLSFLDNSYCDFQGYGYHRQNEKFFDEVIAKRNPGLIEIIASTTLKEGNDGMDQLLELFFESSEEYDIVDFELPLVLVDRWCEINF